MAIHHKIPIKLKRPILAIYCMTLLYKVKVMTQNTIFDLYETPNYFSRHFEHFQNLTLTLTV